MFPTFISILGLQREPRSSLAAPDIQSSSDIQSWWEVPSIAHFCSLFRTAFNLLDFDIEDLEEALLTDGTEETSWLQELIVRLLSGCLPNNEISTFNYQMFLRRLFRQKCQEHDRYNPFNTDCDFTLLPLRTKVDILHALCDFRLDAEDVLDQLKNLEADSLRVEPLGFDKNESAYWYFYGTRLYREDFERKNNKKKAVWQVICFTEDDWFQLTKKFKSSGTKNERSLHHTLSKNFLPELPRLFKEKERQARRRLLENQPRRTSDRIRKLDADVVDKGDPSEQPPLQQKKKEQDERRRDAYEKRSKLKECTEDGHSECEPETRNEMASKKKVKTRQRQPSTDSEATKDAAPKRKKPRLCEKNEDPPPVKLVGRQTNNSLSALDGQIVIQQAAPPASSTKKKLKPSQVFQQTDEDLLVGMHKILDHVKNHEDAWPFVDPVEEEYAPNYYSIIRRPMDLTKMEERLDQGYYKGFDKFKGDFQLIVNNCRLYNGAENEYTLMVDNLLTVFDKATERFLDQITSSDEEIAVENLEGQDELEDKSVKSLKKKKRPESPPRASSRTIKPVLTAQGKKRERASSHESEQEEQSEPKTKKNKKQEKPLKAEHRKSDKASKKPDKGSRKPDKQAKKPDPADDRQTKPAKGSRSKKESKSRSKDKKAKKRSHKKKKSGSIRPSSCSKSSTPSIRSAMSSPPPSSPEDSQPPEDAKLAHSPEDQSKNAVKFKKATFPWELTYFSEDTPPERSPAAKPDDVEDTALSSPPGFSFKPAKDKHNKLRETIEKLKANSEINRLQSPVYEFEVDDQLKENKDRNKKSDEGHAKVHKERPKGGKSSHQSVLKRPAKKSQPRVPDVAQAAPVVASKQSNLEALSLATEQTLKDINKWLDDAPKFDEFSSASNSPSYMTLEDFDLLGAPRPMDIKKVEKVAMPAMAIAPAAPPPIKRDGAAGSAAKEGKKKPFRDPSKFFGKRREIQRTIDRLQPGKSKGNLIANVQGASKSDEIFSLGALNKIKDAKNSLIVKTDTNAPKLSLGSVLDSFGKHKFVVDDQQKEEEEEEEKSKAATATVPAETAKEEDKTKTSLEAAAAATKEETQEVKAEGEAQVEKEATDAKPSEEANAGGPTPNLSAWFKAFGAPKAPPPQKKPDKPDKAEEAQPAGAKSERVPPADPSPSLENAQPVLRQRRISTGSSVSERSSFSQDLDSPRVGIDERGAYLVSYPSPLYRSPSTGASPATASPRPDISPRSPYPFNGGQIRVGFYQDTAASSKSSPDKSCSPRENAPNSPFYQPGAEHVYAPNTTQSGYSGSYTATSPYYTHPPSYSSTNPTPPYNMDGSSNAYYDTKIVDHYQAKPSQNYTANSPASSQNSPAAQPMLSPHSPMVHLPQASPNVQSPSMHSPQLPSPGQSLHSPGMSVVSPQVVSSPGVQHSPSMSVHSPLNPVNMEGFHSQPDETSNCQVAALPMPPDHKANAISNVQQHQMFPVKKRAFLDSELSSQFVALQDEMANRGLQHMSSEQLHLQEQYQKQQMQKHHMQEIQVAQEHIRQQAQAQLQQQKNQFIMQQQQQQKNQQAIQEQHKAQQQLEQQQQQQLLHEQKNQQQQQLLQQQQKNIQLLQHQAMAVFGKVASSEQSLRTPSPQSLSVQQQLPGHSEPSAAIRSMSYATSTSTASGHPYGASFSGRDGYALNVPSSRAMQPPHQQKLDMSKFTNMGYAGPEVNFSRSLQQQYSRPELSYTRTTVQSAISQASQLLNSQPLIASQPSASSVTSLPGYQKPLPNQQQAHSSTYQSGRAVDSVAERLAAQVQQDVSGYKQDARSSYNSTPLDLEQALGLSRNLSNMVDRYSNEQRMMASLQPAPGSYYNDKALSTSHMFNKQIFSQSNMAAMSYSHQQQQQQQQQQQTLQQQSQAQSLYGRQLGADLQPHDLKPSMPAAQPAAQEKKPRKKKGSKSSSTDSSASSLPPAGASSQSGAVGAQSHGFQTYAGLKTAPAPTGASLDPASIALKSASVPGSAFNFGTGGLGMGAGLPESYPNVGLLDEFRGSANYLMCGTNAKPGQTGQSYPPFLNPAAHQGRGAAYPLGGPFMDTSSQLYQHYLQAGVLNQGLLGATSGYPPGYHAAALAMRQPYDSMSRHSWL